MGIINDFSEIKSNRLESLEEIKEIHSSSDEGFSSDSFEVVRTSMLYQNKNDEPAKTTAEVPFADTKDDHPSGSSSVLLPFYKNYDTLKSRLSKAYKTNMPLF